MSDDRLKRPPRPWLLWGTTLLVANSSYLAATGSPILFYFLNLLLHVGLGVVLLIPFWLWARKNSWTLAGRLGNSLLALSALAGLVLLVIDNTRNNRPWLLAHIILAILGLLLLLAAFVNRHRERIWLFSTASLALAIALPLVALWWQARDSELRHSISNPPAPLTMADEAMGGESGPFFPSSVETTHGGPVPAERREICSRSCPPPTS